MSSSRVATSTISPLDKRNDLHLTSTGIGHMYREDTALFPPANFQYLFNRPLPSKYCHRQSPDYRSPSDYYQLTTTSRSQYYHKPLLENQEIFKKSPTLLKINYTNNTTAKLGAKSWRDPLTMGNQRSEMRDRYQGRQGKVVPQQSLDRADRQSMLVEGMLLDHHNNGLTKRLKPTYINTVLKGKPYHAEDQSVHYRNQPYMTTNNWFHRQFPTKELASYPKKDGATYWVCEDYPKAWGHGTNENPLPKLFRSSTDSSNPMRDEMTFRTQTYPTPRTTKVQLVSNGLKTEYCSRYVEHPSDDIFKPLAKPLIIRTDKDTSLMATVPNMYKTTNEVYGLVQ